MALELLRDGKKTIDKNANFVLDSLIKILFNYTIFFHENKDTFGSNNVEKIFSTLFDFKKYLETIYYSDNISNGIADSQKNEILGRIKEILCFFETDFLDEIEKSKDFSSLSSIFITNIRLDVFRILKIDLD